MTDILSDICDTKREHIRRMKLERSEVALLEEASQMAAPRGFLTALKRKQLEGFGLIAEIKRASPSKGIICLDYSPPEFAIAYERGGATCLSVLTDRPYFQGENLHLKQARSASKLPILRKDFMLDPYQIIESRVLGADCILLIMAALTDEQANELFNTAIEMKLDVLIEVHNEYELDRALSNLPAKMIGMNNRNLKTFETSLEITKTLAKRLSAGVLGVSESGIYTHEDLLLLGESGISSFLVGESLMRQKDIEQATKQLLGAVA